MFLIMEIVSSERLFGGSIEERVTAMARKPSSFVHAAAAAAAFVAVSAAPAHADEVRVMMSGAFAAAQAELGPEYERKSHDKITLLASAMGTGTASIPSRVQSGEDVDVVIVTAAALDDLIKKGLVLADSRVDLARSGIGMVVKAGAPKPDIGSVEALKRTLLNAKSIAHSAAVSGIYVSTELFQRLGIADQALSKSKKIENEPVGAVVARGEAEVGFQQISELLSVPGVEYVGPLPGEVQRITTFSGGVLSRSTHPKAARAFLEFLASPEAVPAIKRSGLEAVHASNPASVQGVGKYAFRVVRLEDVVAGLKMSNTPLYLDFTKAPEPRDRNVIIKDNDGNWIQFFQRLP